MAFRNTDYNRGSQLFRPGSLEHGYCFESQSNQTFLNGRTDVHQSCLMYQHALRHGQHSLHSAQPRQLTPQCHSQAGRSSNNRRKHRLSFSRWHMMISSRYKTELCRQFSEDGDCPFEDKCLFAHGQTELRSLPRHPKYKTELCRDFHQVGFCSFGPRCNFIHTATDVASLSARLFDKRSSTPDSGNESNDDQSCSLPSASPIPTLDQVQEDTFFHFPENLYRELTEDSIDEVLECNDQL